MVNLMQVRQFIDELNRSDMGYALRRASFAGTSLSQGTKAAFSDRLCTHISEAVVLEYPADLFDSEMDACLHYWDVFYLSPLPMGDRDDLFEAIVDGFKIDFLECEESDPEQLQEMIVAIANQ